VKSVRFSYNLLETVPFLGSSFNPCNYTKLYISKVDCSLFYFSSYYLSIGFAIVMIFYCFSRLDVQSTKHDICVAWMYVETNVQFIQHEYLELSVVLTIRKKKKKRETLLLFHSHCISHRNARLLYFIFIS